MLLTLRVRILESYSQYSIIFVEMFLQVFYCNFLSQHFIYFINRPTELECSITLGWKVLSQTNTLAFWAHLYVPKKMKFFENSPRGSSTVVERSTHDPNIEGSNPGAVFTTLHFLCKDVLKVFNGIFFSPGW
jgi:hypothetical protein